jgi:diaminohydroxyphosphoribosylaminopyrimidine deaminase/5-amino-6-(5-phosphoribosylamino)uracil reductase
VSLEDDIRLMRLAIGAAQAVLGETWPNPAVGCVIAKDGVVLAQAATAPGGRPHAEEQALQSLGEGARGATVYITLEPCGRRRNGNTACADLLSHAGVARVVIAAENPESYSGGLGLNHLHDHGVPYETGLLADEVAPLYAGFRHRLATGLPLVEEKADGAGFDGMFQAQPGEDLAAALRRLGAAGYTRLWVPVGSDLAFSLKTQGFLG